MKAANDILTRDRILELFEKLDARMLERDIEARVFVIGGAAIALTLSDERVTSDIDGKYENPSLDKLVHEIAAEEGLPFGWLNHSVASVFSYFKTDSESVTVFTGKRLNVQSASPEFVLATKLASRREKDIDDVLLLADKLGIKTKEAMFAVVERYFNADLSAAAYQRQQIEEFIDLLLEEGLLEFSE